MDWIKTPLLLAAAALGLAVPSLAGAADAHAPVTIREDAELYVLDNGIVTASVAKASGDLVSLRFQGAEMLATRLTPEGTPDLVIDPPGANPKGLNPGMTDHQYGFWSHDAMGPKDGVSALASVSIDASKNDGARAEVAVKGISKDRKMGTGPGSRGSGQFAADVEIRYMLERGQSGVYTYCVFTHPADYPASALGEARFCAKLADFFDWVSIDEKRNRHYPVSEGFGDKYVFTAVQFDNPAFGWSSTTRKVGFWIVNPSMEYMSGGPTKVEFLCHRDTNAVAAPCVLNYWRSSHYGGAVVEVAEGEAWTKVVGPFLLYANSGDTPQAMYDEARARQQLESSRWPYDWVAGVDYPQRGQRASVSGRMVLRDPAAAASSTGGFGRLMVGLTAPAYVTAGGRAVDWQTDAKHYQFWARGGADGRFEIPGVRPGTYTFHAFADGVPGEFIQTQVTVEAGVPLDLADLAWTPAHRGVLVWQVGIPNRSASEFAGGDRPFDPEMPLEYARRFPNDVTFIVGRSDPARDWFFQHVPHNEDPKARPVNYRGVPSPGRATPFTIRFTLDKAPSGQAWLRLGFCGTGTRELTVAVNDQPAGTVPDMVLDGVIPRHGSHGLYYERELAIPASMLRAGENALTLTVPAGPVNNGVIYDYVRLELEPPAEAAAPAPTAPAATARCVWKDGAIERHADWARAVAEAQGVPFIDLHELIASRYDEMGQEQVKLMFADGMVHTSAAGAEFNAACVVAGLRSLRENPVSAYLKNNDT